MLPSALAWTNKIIPLTLGFGLTSEQSFRQDERYLENTTDPSFCPESLNNSSTSLINGFKR